MFWRQPSSRSFNCAKSESPSRRIASPSTTPRAARNDSTPILSAVWMKSVRGRPSGYSLAARITSGSEIARCTYIGS